jgi:uroporphyrin-3 C-methyltransferase
MDEKSANIEPTISFFPETDTGKKRAPSNQILLSWGTLGISILALILSGAALFFYQKRPTPIQHSSTPVKAQTFHNKDWQNMQNQMQQLEHAQQQLSTQIATNQHQIQNLIQAQQYPSQDWGIQKARYYLDLAKINTNWSHDSQATLSLLQHADQILAHANHPNVQRIREAIAEDITTLMQIPIIDTQGILAKLTAINNQISGVYAQFYSKKETHPNYVSAPTATWRDNWESSLQQLRGLISIRYQEESALTPLRPDDITLLRENIRMNLQQAGLGLIEQHPALFTQALQAAANSISFGFNPKNPQTHAILQSLQTLQKTPVAYPPPSLHPYTQLFDASQTSDKQVPS